MMLGDEWHHIDYLATLERGDALRVRINRELRANRLRERIKWTIVWAIAVAGMAVWGWILTAPHAQASPVSWTCANGRWWSAEYVAPHCDVGSPDDVNFNAPPIDPKDAI
jgi:hypothetical protein